MWFTTLRYGAQFSHIDKWFQEIFRIVLFSKTLSWWSYLFEAIVMIKNCSIQKLKQFQNPLEMEIIIYYGISSTRDKLLLFNFPKSQYLLSYSFHESLCFFVGFFSTCWNDRVIFYILGHYYIISLEQYFYSIQKVYVVFAFTSTDYNEIFSKKKINLYSCMWTCEKMK